MLRKILIKERIYGKNQVVEKLDEDTVKVSLDMQNKNAIISFILSCGTDVKVISPQWLIDEVKIKLIEMLNVI